MRHMRVVREVPKRRAPKCITKEELGQYQEPRSIQVGLAQSMREEEIAAYWYRKRAKDAREKGDETTAKVYEHIADEEDVHYREFKERMLKVN